MDPKVMNHETLGHTVVRSDEEEAAAMEKGFSHDVHSTVVKFGHGDKKTAAQKGEDKPEVDREYPKAMYRADHHTKGGSLVVKDAKGEAAAKALGYSAKMPSLDGDKEPEPKAEAPKVAEAKPETPKPAPFVVPSAPPASPVVK